VSQLEFDEQAAERIEAMYRSEDAARRRRLVRAALAAAPGERVLDAGCGPGFYCAEIAAEVGPTGSVVGTDASPAMLSLAERRCAALANVELRAGDALALPVEDASADAAICVQVLEYVADVDAALAELRRVLRPGGRVLVWDVDWATLSVHGEDRALTERVLAAWDEHLAHPTLPRTLVPRLHAAGFAGAELQGHAFVASGRFDTERYGAALVPFIGAFVAGRQGLTEAEAQAWVAEQRALGDRGAFYFACVQCAATANRPG
jgi:arsenite methyltransferase